MRQIDVQLLLGQIPKGAEAVPIAQSQQGTGLKLYVLVSSQSDPNLRNFYLFREMLDARVLLSCITDAAKHLRQWIELWMENTAEVISPSFATVGVVEDDLRDKRWEHVMRGTSCLDKVASPSLKYFFVIADVRPPPPGTPAVYEPRYMIFNLYIDPLKTTKDMDFVTGRMGVQLKNGSEGTC